MNQYTWSVDSALWQMNHGEENTPKMDSARTFLSEIILKSDDIDEVREVASSLLEDHKCGQEV